MFRVKRQMTKKTLLMAGIAASALVLSPSLSIDGGHIHIDSNHAHAAGNGNGNGNGGGNGKGHGAGGVGNGNAGGQGGGLAKGKKNAPGFEKQVGNSAETAEKNGQSNAAPSRKGTPLENTALDDVGNFLDKTFGTADADTDDTDGAKKEKVSASELGKLNAAKANENALNNAASNSTVGAIADGNASDVANKEVSPSILDRVADMIDGAFIDRDDDGEDDAVAEGYREQADDLEADNTDTDDTTSDDETADSSTDDGGSTEDETSS